MFSLFDSGIPRRSARVASEADFCDTHHDVAWFDFSVDKVSLDRVLPLKLFSEYPFYL